MALPLVAIAGQFALAAGRAVLPAVGRMLFGSVPRAAITTASADLALNDGRLTGAATSGAFNMASEGISNFLLDKAGLRDPNNPDAGLLDSIMADPTKAIGMLLTAVIGYALLNGVTGSPILSAIGAIAGTTMLNGQIGDLTRNFAAMATGQTTPELAPVAVAAEATTQQQQQLRPAALTPTLGMGGGGW